MRRAIGERTRPGPPNPCPRPRRPRNPQTLADLADATPPDKQARTESERCAESPPAPPGRAASKQKKKRVCRKYWCARRRTAHAGFSGALGGWLVPWPARPRKQEWSILHSQVVRVRSDILGGLLGSAPSGRAAARDELFLGLSLVVFASFA